MNPELLRTVYFSVEALYPPLPRFSGTQLQQLYVEISQRHLYEVFRTVAQEGARLTTEEEKECQIRRNRIVLIENIRAGFEHTARNFQDIITIVHQALNIPVFFGVRFVLRAMWECDSPDNAVSFIRDRLLNIKSDQFELLGVPVQGSGLRIRCPGLPERVHDFRIEPYFRDPKHLFIELISTFPPPIQTPKIFEERMEETRQFLMERIKDFILSFG